VKKEIGIGSSIEDGSNSSRSRKWIGVYQKIDGRAEFQSGPKLIPFLVFTKSLTKKTGKNTIFLSRIWIIGGCPSNILILLIYVARIR
jgi:hypothetical protein